MQSQTYTALRSNEAAEAPSPVSEPLGPVTVRIHKLSDFTRRGQPTSVIEEGQEWLGTLSMRDHAHEAFDEAEGAYLDEEPVIPEICTAIDQATGTTRPLDREEMWKQAVIDWGGSGAAWMERVLAFDRWRLDCLTLEASLRLPQLRDRLEGAESGVTQLAHRVMERPATTPREAAVKLGVYLFEVAELVLEDEDILPLRRLFAELLAMGTPPASAVEAAA